MLVQSARLSRFSIDLYGRLCGRGRFTKEDIRNFHLINEKPEKRKKNATLEG